MTWLLFLVLGCQDDSVANRHLEAPVGVTVLPIEGSPFDRPVGLFSNSRGGKVVAVDPSRGWLLSMDPAAPFLAEPGIAFGARRVLGDVVSYSPDGSVVWVYAGDSRTGTLLSTTWIDGVDEQGTPTVAVASHDADTEAPEINDVELQQGATTTEIWTLTWEGKGWAVEGSISGRQSSQALPWIGFESDQQEVRFKAPVGEEGDVLEFSTDTGVRSHDLGGTIQSLVGIPGTDLLVASVLNLETAEGGVVLWDMTVEEVISTLELEPTAVPLRVSLADEGEVLYVSDAALPVVYEVLLQGSQDEDSPRLELLRSLQMPGAVTELAWAEGDGFERLFLAVEGEGSVRILDLVEEDWVDANPLTAEVDGVDVGSPLQGIVATGRLANVAEQSSFGGSLHDEIITLATLSGEMWFLSAESGCLVETATGPLAYVDPDQPFADAGSLSNPVLEDTGFGSRPVQLNSCAGLVRDESWVATYDEIRGGWEVEGNLSGVQTEMALEDERFLSDDGAMSFLIRAGSAPSTAGDRFRWFTVAGVAGVTGVDRDGDGSVDLALRHPGRPVAFQGYMGLGEPNWVEPSVRMLWPITSGDIGLVVDVNTAKAVAVLD